MGGASALPTPGATVTAIDFARRGASTLHDREFVRFTSWHPLPTEIHSVARRSR